MVCEDLDMLYMNACWCYRRKKPKKIPGISIIYFCCVYEMLHLFKVFHQPFLQQLKHLTGIFGRMNVHYTNGTFLTLIPFLI